MENETSWEPVEGWYDQTVGKKGHYYHQHVIFPALTPLLEFKKFSECTLLDLACGQGVLARHLPKKVAYFGIDASPSFIKAAKQQKPENHHFQVGDICKPLPFESDVFTHATIILALQNIADPLHTIREAFRCLKPGGLFLLVLNHPCFRIPRQSHWGIDASKKLQYRRIDTYLSPLKIPIQVHPSKKQSENVLSFHYPLSMICRFLEEGGFVISTMEEWTSDKESTGPSAKMENRARKEFPLFLAIKAKKL